MAPREEKESKKNPKGGKATSEPSQELSTEDCPDPTSGNGKFYYPNGATYEGEWILAPDPNELNLQMKADSEGKNKDKKGAKGEKVSKDDKKKGDGKNPPKSPKQEAAAKENKKHEGGKNVEDGSPTSGDAPLKELEQEKPRPNRFRHGRGVYIDGEYQYEGEWKDDQISGQGTFKYASGASYEGNWEMNKYFGQGEYKWGDGRSYKGDWRENKMHGMGVYTDISGQKYVGHFFNGTGPGLSCEIE